MSINTIYNIVKFVLTVAAVGLWLQAGRTTGKVENMSKYFVLLLIIPATFSVNSGCSCDSNKSKNPDAGALTDAGSDSSSDSDTDTDTDADSDTDTDSDTGVKADITVSSADVRSCDILILENGVTIEEANFSDDVLGETGRWAPRFALSFASKTDAAIANVGDILIVGSGDFSMSKVTCFDRTGTAVDSPGVAIGD